MKTIRFITLVTTLLALMFLTGCVQQQSATVHNTLKGDASVAPAMQKSFDLPDSGFLSLSELTDQFCSDFANMVPERKV